MNLNKDFSGTDLAQQTLETPSIEPARQYYFIEKCREIVKERSLETGRELLANVTTFGCQMNAKDSEKLRGIIREIGFSITESEEADLVLYNTCTVRENANLKVYGHLGYLSNLKKKNPHMIIALCGCMMQEPDVVAKLQKSYRFVNLIFGTHNIFKFAELLYEVLEGQRNADQMMPPEPAVAAGVETPPSCRPAADRAHYYENACTQMGAVEMPPASQKHAAAKSPMIVDIWKDTDQVVEDLPADRTYSFKSGVNIMYGCNNFCTYCIVPYVRGRERSRRPEDIIREIEQLSKDGVIEVMLLGQNVNSYGKTLDEPVSFAHLLEMVEQVPGIRRIRFMTSHPKDLSDELIEVMKRSQKVCRHLHLPLQSGSSRILKKMNRRYTKEQYLDLAAKLRREIPDISLTTDIIVGFPGETEEDFQETLDVVRQVRYDSAFTFIYSKRTGTPAAAMEDQVPDDVVKDRFQRLLTLVQEISQEMSKRVEGQTLPVLVESLNDHDPALVTGRLSNNLLVHFPGREDLIGQIVDVRLSECKGFYYLGERV